ncbi:MAG TPA: hypothetical protein VEN79_18640, partial [Terriglobia bacterium]|nr:hypothetical protein [Terriglobia bacterium]
MALNRLAAQRVRPLGGEPFVARAAMAPGSGCSQSAERDGVPLSSITIDYPRDGSIFPPDIIAPTFFWRDAAKDATAWLIEVAFSDGSASLRAKARGDRFRIGEIDPRAISDTNELPRPTPLQAAAHTWKPDEATWEAIKKHSVERPATVTITGFRKDQSEQPISRGQASIQTSKDPVGAPIFFRDVPLIPAKT